MIKRLLKWRLRAILKKLQYSNGLFSASYHIVNTGYNNVWIRDNIYETLGLESTDKDAVARTITALFKLMRKHEHKIDSVIKCKPQDGNHYLHPRYNPLTLEEFHEPWGNKQNDAIGAFIFKACDLADKKIIKFSNDDKRILQKLVKYLASIEYWHDADNGMWEENMEVHASSVGACLAGLQKAKKHVAVPQHLIDNGRKALDELLPRESETKETDMALLSLIYPYDIVTSAQRDAILWNIEKKLVRKRGVIRYAGDKYYSNGKEAEWTMGLLWLAIIYKKSGSLQRAKHYLNRALATMNWKLEFPELYFGYSKDYNKNTPLGWSQSLAIVALEA